MSDLTVTIFFDWAQASADPRQYNQQRTLLLPNVEIAVNVPLKAMYIHNAEEIIQAQISSGGHVKPVLTPLGMVYADNVLRDAYATPDEGEVGEYVDTEIEWQDTDELVSEKPEDDEFPVEEETDDEEDELDEILWEN